VLAKVWRWSWKRRVMPAMAFADLKERLIVRSLDVESERSYAEHAVRELSECATEGQAHVVP